MQSTIDKGFGPFGHVTHIFSTTAKIAWLFWQQYRMTLDEGWLAETGYPIIRDAALFYITMPQLREGPDGRLHLYHVNNHEANWDCADSISEMSGIRGILPIAIRAAEILGADEELRARWSGALDRLAPLVTSKSPDASGGPRPAEPETWVNAAVPCKTGRPSSFANDPFYFYDLYTLESPRDEVAENTYRYLLERPRFGYDAKRRRVHVLDKICAIAARRGDRDTIEHVVWSQMACEDNAGFCDNQGSAHTTVLDNRLTLREGPQAIGCQRLGRAVEGLAHALCSSVPPSPGQDEVLHVFAAAPLSWDVEFSLPARGCLQVRGEQRDGRIRCVEVAAGKAGTFAIKNPFTGKTERVTLGAGEVKRYER
jgi:hypothetical protein